MPNWCENRLHISGPAEVMRKFVEATCDASKLTLNKALPRPELEGDGWYNWSIANWGTKWDIQDATLNLNEEGTEARTFFSTAWSPPVPWLFTVGADYPELHFELLYYEPGAYFAGCAIVEDGEGYDDERDVVETEIELHGEAQRCCDECGGDYSFTKPEDQPADGICFDCDAKRCVNCSKAPEEHGAHENEENVKCLFASTLYVAKGAA